MQGSFFAQAFSARLAANATINMAYKDYAGVAARCNRSDALCIA
jgi:hypothetical protein